MTDWYLPETAPKDGTNFLAWDGKRVLIALWLEPSYADGTGDWSDDGCRALRFPILRWSPIDPPSAGTDSAA